jgi:disulfide bond formation protein DsbB
MNEQVTVDEAIKKGHQMVTNPVVILMFVILFLSTYLAISQDIWWMWPVGIISCATIPWLYWSIRITQWKIWAFKNVRNVHELERRAVREKLLWPDGSIFNKTEIWSTFRKQQWIALQSNFNVDDVFVFEEDPTIPYETIIYYSKKKKIAGITVIVLIIVIGIILLATGVQYLLGIVLCTLGAYVVITEYKHINDRSPQIIINEKGIQTKSTPFYGWRNIWDEEVVLDTSDEYNSYYLSFRHSDGLTKVQTADLDIHHNVLKRLLNIYRGRYIKQTA